MFLVVLDIRLHCLWACGSIKSSATQTTSQCHHSLVYRQKWAWLSSNKSSLFSSCWERLRILSPCSFPWLHFSVMVVCRRLPSLVMCMVTCPLWLTEKRRDDASPKSSALPSPPTRQAPTPCAHECCRVSSLKHGLKNRVWFEVAFRTTRAPLEKQHLLQVNEVITRLQSTSTSSLFRHACVNGWVFGTWLAWTDASRLQLEHILPDRVLLDEGEFWHSCAPCCGCRREPRQCDV